VGVRSWRGVALSGVCPRRGWLAAPSELKARRADKLALDHQTSKLHDAGNFAEQLPLLQRTVALNMACCGAVSGSRHAHPLKRLAQNYFLKASIAKQIPKPRCRAARGREWSLDNAALLKPSIPREEALTRMGSVCRGGRGAAGG
jgi:hypothetical protein